MYADALSYLGNDVTINVGGKIKDFSPYDRVVIYHGNENHVGDVSLNLFGGLQGFDASNILAISKARPKEGVVSLAIPFPDYGSMIKSRMKSMDDKGKEYPDIWKQIDFEQLTHLHENVSGAPMFDMPVTKGLVIGDSHAICMYRPGWGVWSIPFKTLHGALNIGLTKLVDQWAVFGTPPKIHFYFGNIDIRHHFCRDLEDVNNASSGQGFTVLPRADEIIRRVKTYTDKYIEQLKEVEDAYPNAEVKVYEPLPIEHESRRLPKSGYYKGKPFHGSWADRNAAREAFIAEIPDRYLIRWTDYLKNDAGELDFAHMEKPQSVHLARSSYPYWTGLETDNLEQFFA